VEELAMTLVLPLALVERYVEQGRVILTDGCVDAGQVALLAANLSAYRLEQEARCETALGKLIAREDWKDREPV
jgi:hypothetical protein